MRMEEKLMYEDKVHKIIQGIAAAMANSYDGATDENGDPIKIGLRREEGDPVLDSRVMDGFGCKIQGDLLVVKYNTEENLKGLRGIHHITFIQLHIILQHFGGPIGPYKLNPAFSGCLIRDRG